MRKHTYPSGHNQYLVAVTNFHTTLHTAGNGLWSNDEKTIKHSKADVVYWDFDDEAGVGNDISKVKYAELRVYFPKKNWDVSKHGLIYTDKRWLRELRAYLKRIGFSARAANNVDYSEQGMQGDNYVSLDIGRPFIKACLPRLKK